VSAATVTQLPAVAPAPLELPATEPVPASSPLWAWARRPFAQDEIELLPKPLTKEYKNGECNRPDRDGIQCGGWHAMPCIHLMYVGHAGLTMRLYEVDPFWSWEPMAFNIDPDLLKLAISSGSTEMVDRVMRNGTPRIEQGSMWIRMTLLGQMFVGVGDAGGKSGPNAVKEIIGDALRNAAMRAGIGTYLWSKSERAMSMKDRGEGLDPAQAQAEEEASRRRGQQAEARQQRRQQTRSSGQQRPPATAPAPAQAPAPTPEPVRTATAISVLAAAETDPEKIRATWREARARDLNEIDVTQVLLGQHRDWLDVAALVGLIVPGRPVTLGGWLAACAKHVDGQGGLTISAAARAAATSTRQEIQS